MRHASYPSATTTATASSPFTSFRVCTPLAVVSWSKAATGAFTVSMSHAVCVVNTRGQDVAADAGEVSMIPSANATIANGAHTINPIVTANARFDSRLPMTPPVLVMAL